MEIICKVLTVPLFMLVLILCCITGDDFPHRWRNFREGDTL